MKRSAVTLVCVAIFATAIGVRPASASVSAAERQVEVSVFSKINNRRAGLGPSREIEDAFIRSQAEQHSDAMARRGLLGHFGFTKRVAAIEANDSGIRSWICENVAYVSGSSISATQAASMIFHGWMNSPPHRKCMLDEDGATTQSAGIGITHAGNTWWATFIAAHDTTP
jgi:uncharacterized protein YkwD